MFTALIVKKNDIFLKKKMCYAEFLLEPNNLNFHRFAKRFMLYDAFRVSTIFEIIFFFTGGLKKISETVFTNQF